MIDINKFYKENSERQIRMVSRILHFGKDQASDIVHDAYAKVLDNMDQYDETKAGFNTWFNKILFNTLRDFQRNNPVMQPLSEEMVLTDEPYEYLIIQRGLTNTSNKLHREVLALFYLKGYTSKEIYNTTGVSVSSVTTICARFKQMLKEEYGVEL